jgi:hypothetical protein
MDLNGLLWIMSVALAYYLIFMMFETPPLRPRMRHTAIALSVVTLTARIIRIETTNIRLDFRWENTPLPHAVVITLFFEILADIGAPCLIILGTLVTMMEVAWVVDSLAARDEL